MKKHFKAILGVVMTIIMIVGGACAAEAHAEPVPSITLEDLYRVVSNVFFKSDADHNMVECECIRLDMEIKEAIKTETVESEIFFPALPRTLIFILLTDGSHAIPAQWHWTDENSIYVAFRTADLLTLDGTVGLHLFLFAYMD